MSGMNRRRHNGQSTTEYGVVIALIAVIAIAALASASVAVGGAFGFINQRVQAVIPAASGSGSAPTALVSPATQTVGQTVTVSGTGYTPDSTVTITLHSTPVVLGTTMSDNSGNVGPVSETIPLSTDTSITHTITLSTATQTGDSNDLTVNALVLPIGISDATVGAMTVCPSDQSVSQCSVESVTDGSLPAIGEFVYVQFGDQLGISNLIAQMGPPANLFGFPSSVETPANIAIFSGPVGGAGVTSALDYYASSSVQVLLPVYTAVQGSGANVTCTVSGVVRVELIATSNNNTTLTLVLRSLNGYVPSPTPTPTPTATPAPSPTPTLAPTPTPPAAPAAAFTAPSASRGVAATFTSSSTGTITTYNWHWGDGSADGTTATATHTYNTRSTFTVTLTVTGPGGSNSISHSVTVS